MFRHEEDSNHIDFYGVYNDEAFSIFEKSMGGTKIPPGTRMCTMVDTNVHISISRFGEMLFRISFDEPIDYDAARDRWVKGVCQSYIRLFSMLLEGLYLSPF